MACTCEDALAALSDHLGLPLEFSEDTCAFNIDGQPFTISRYDGPLRLVVSALVADDLPVSPSRKLVCDLLDLGFGMLCDGLPSVARDPDLGFISVFTAYACETMVAAEFPDQFDKFVEFSMSVADRIDSERSGVADVPLGEAAEAGQSPSVENESLMQV